jgi:biopolymer transport protein ExbD
MVDVWLLLLIVTILQAVFGVDKVRLPELVRVESSHVSSQTVPGLQVALKSNGDVTFEGELIPLENLSARITAEPDRAVELTVETDQDGRGAAQALIQLLRDLSNADVGGRVEVLYSKTSGS